MVEFWPPTKTGAAAAQPPAMSDADGEARSDAEILAAQGPSQQIRWSCRRSRWPRQVAVIMALTATAAAATTAALASAAMGAHAATVRRRGLGGVVQKDLQGVLSGLKAAGSDVLEQAKGDETVEKFLDKHNVDVDINATLDGVQDALDEAEGTASDILDKHKDDIKATIDEVKDTAAKKGAGDPEELAKKAVDLVPVDGDAAKAEVKDAVSSKVGEARDKLDSIDSADLVP